MSRSASIRYAGSSGSDTISMNQALYLVTTPLQVNNMWKDSFGYMYRVHLSRCGPYSYKINLHSEG